MNRYTILNIFVLLYLFIGSNAQLGVSELNCLTDLSVKFGLLDTDCSTSNGAFRCSQLSDGSYHVVEVVIRQKNTNYMTLADMICFPNITYFHVENGYLYPDFLSSTFQDSLSFIRLINCEGSDQQFALPIYKRIKSLSISFKNSINLVINLSNIRTLADQLVIEFINSTIQNQSSLKFNNDLVSPWTLSSIFMYANHIPNLNNVFIDSQFYLQTRGSPNEGYSNIKTFKGIKQLIFNNLDPNPFDFPKEFSEIRSYGSSFDISLAFANVLNKPNNYIDLSNTGITSLSIIEVGPNFNIDGNIPLILPTTIAGFTISGGSYSNIPSFSGIPIISMGMERCNLKLNLSNYKVGSFPSTLRKLVLRGNQLTGTIDESLCSLFLDISNNSLSGTLPSCMSCYYNDSQAKTYLEDNKFDSFAPCNNIIPNVEHQGDSYLQITGKDIGYGGTTLSINSLTNPLASPIMTTFNYWSIRYLAYGTIFNTETLFTITFPSTPPQTLTVSTNKTIAPKVSLVKPVLSQLNVFLFQGQYFTYNTSDIQVAIDNKPCQVLSSTFYNFTCSVGSDFDLSKRRVVSNIKVNQQRSTQITILDLGSTNIINYCSKDCGNEYCLSDIGECGCLFECVNGGTCDSSNSKCKCPNNWIGDSCSIPVHYVSAVTPSTIKGGVVKIYGFFGNVNKGLSVILHSNDGDKACSPIISLSNDTITCMAPEGSGIKDLNVTQNGISFIGKSMYIYINPVLKCPNNCTSKDNGVCDTNLGECKCKDGYSGYDCGNLKNQNNTSSENNSNNPPIILPTSTTSIDNQSAVTKISNQETFYEISITELHEVSISGESINKFNLVKKWDISKDPDSTSYIFKQQLGNSTISTITYIIQEINQTSQFTFADIPFTLEADSIKISVIIENFQFINSLSTLSLYFNTAASTSTSTSNQNNCNQKDTEIDTSNVNNEQMQNSYISISKNSKVLTGRFINRALSDGKSTFISSTIVSKNSDSLLVSLNLPHCNEKCVLDPDFSVLVSPEFKECQSSNKKSWVLPVAIVLPCVFVVVSVIIVSLVVRKNRASVLLLKKKLTNTFVPSKKQDLYMPSGDTELKKV